MGFEVDMEAKAREKRRNKEQRKRTKNEEGFRQEGAQKEEEGKERWIQIFKSWKQVPYPKRRSLYCKKKILIGMGL